MKTATAAQLDSLLVSLGSTYDVRLPILLPDGTRVIGAFDDGPPALHGGSILSKPTSVFFPQQEIIFKAVEGSIEEIQVPAQPLFVLGFTHRDLACLRFIDRFFAEGFRDDVYFSSRHGAVIAGLSGYCGDDGSLIRPAGRDCDLEFFYDGTGWLIVPYSETGRSIIADLPDAAPSGALEVFRQASELPPDENERVIQRASELLRAERVPDFFWAEIGDRCIACTGCNLACPTCTCFGVQDWRSGKLVERSRMWDSCQLDGFMREAGGHNPLGSEALRTRRRIHHKLAADPEKWGEISCFLCGRCDLVCPTGIGMVAVAKEMVARFGA